MGSLHKGRHGLMPQQPVRWIFYFMAKRFVNPDWKALRKLTPNLQRAYFYCWDKADACGVYEYDPVYLKADLGLTISLKELCKLPGAKLLDGERLLFTDFILTNYGTLKEGYNPHKPVFRALEKNKISSLNQACTMLEDEEEGEEEDKDEEEGETVLGPKETFINPFGENWQPWQGWKDYKREEHGERYKSPKTELAALMKLQRLSGGNPETAKLVIQQSIESRWKGFFKLNDTNNGTGKTEYGTPERAEQYERLFAERYGNG